MSKTLYDFYTQEDQTHFGRDRMTEEGAKAYAKKYYLTFEEVKLEEGSE